MAQDQRRNILPGREIGILIGTNDYSDFPGHYNKEWIKEKFVIGEDSLQVKGKGFTQKEKQFMYNKSKLARKL